MKLVKQSKKYSCGASALCTILINKGIEATEKELIELSKTDESGVSMYNLIHAVKAKGLDAVAYSGQLTSLQPLDMVFLNVNGTYHFSVIGEVKEKVVELLDPSLGHIELSTDTFIETWHNGVYMRVMEDKE